MQNSPSKLFLLDAYALIFRAHYAFLKNPMRNAAGLNTSAVFGFTKFLRDIIAREKPKYLGVAFDPRGGNFRHKLDPNYKANRAATPEDIIAAVPYIKRILNAMCIPVLEVAGYEADDVIGTLAREASEKGFTTFMVTPDKDYGQLVGPRTFIYKQRKNGEGVEIVDAAAIKAQYGVDDPRLVADILALWGDVSDNVPGVPGIGEKGAAKLVGQWGDVDNILDAAEAGNAALSPKIRENLIAGAEQLRMSKRLVTIDTRVPIDFAPDELEMCDPDRDALVEIYKELGFNQFLRGIESEKLKVKSEQITTKPAAPVEQDLFSTAAVSQARTVDIQSVGELEALLAGRHEFAFALETAGKDYFTGRIVGASITVEGTVEGETIYRMDSVEWLAPWLSDERVAKIGYDLKTAMHFLRTAGISLGGRLMDVMIVGYLLDPEGNRPRAENAAEALRMKRELWPTLQAQGSTGLAELYQRVEEPLIGVLEAMEREGVRIDAGQLGASARELAGQLAELENSIREMTNEPALNVNSSLQLGEALFGKMRLVEKPARTKTRQYKTDEETLAALRGKHPVVGKILEYRGVKKLLSTYVEALPRLVNPLTGKIHTTYNQAVTATGRLSSTNPNLQNIPIREEQGRPIRRAFVASDDHHVLLSADYSQVELRIMAHLSGDEALIEAFRAGEDIHRATAARIFGVPLAEVTSEQRRRAKTANFGIIYGISSFGLAQRLGIPRIEATAIIEGYFRSYPGVKRYMENAARDAREHGFVETLFGRRRYLPDINSSNGNIRALAERNAINAPIQGSAADIMKIAMVRIFSELARAGLRSKMILQVHDEVVVDVWRSELERVRALVEDAMEHAAKLSVDLVVDSGSGENWLAAH